MEDVIRGPGNFSPEGEPSAVSIKWEEWLEEFQAFADAKGIFDKDGVAAAAQDMRARRKALLLYQAGARVREITKGLEATDRDNYAGLVDKLNVHFKVEVNSTFQRHLFRKMSQKEDESVSQFCARLRKAATTCDFGDTVEEHIRDQIVETCKSSRFRRKLLEKGNTLTLTKTLAEAANFEAVEHRTKEMSQGTSQPEVNRVRTKAPRHRHPPSSQSSHGRQSNPSTYGRGTFRSANSEATSQQCHRCGKDKSHTTCPAMGKECHQCKKKNHFKHMCKSKPSVNAVQVHSRELSSPDSTLSPITNSDNHFAFSLQSPHINTCQLHRVNVNVGGVQVRLIVDSGADCNVIDQSLWEELKQKQIKVSKSVAGGPSVYPYSSGTPLKVVGQFWVNLESASGKKVTNAKFLVVETKAEAILGVQASVELGLVHFANQTCTTDYVDYSKLKDKFPVVFADKIGRAKGEIKLTVDESVAPIAQPFRRVPFSLRQKLELHLRELAEQDIIEKVEGPVSWASPVVIVPKPDQSIRLCVDMRQANAAIVRHNFPVPTIDELLLDMNGSRVFSKIDLKSGFHQFVLSEDSRDITTFTTHLGLFRYKRLMFGISSAPEIYQYMVSQTIRGIPGAVNLADDILVHGRTREEHDARLIRTLQALERSGMTLNERKCVFGSNQIDFLGHRLSDKGVDPGRDKVRAIAEATEPKTVGEMKSFLGLAGYCSKFIENFSSKTETLRNKTLKLKPQTPITLNAEERKAFTHLKSSLANADTLAYFKVEQSTKLYTDAGPAGIGCILVQTQNGEDRVVCYASRALTNVERRYCQTEKEALAIVWACERLHHYLFGTKFQLMTDHKPLEVIYGNKRKQTSARIERWVLRLQSYDFTVQYISGERNIADPLSRMLKPEGRVTSQASVNSDEDAELFVRNIALGAVADLGAITARQVERESDTDNELLTVRAAIQNNQLDTLPREFKPVKEELCVLGRLVLRGNRLVIPVGLRNKMLQLGHEGHLGIVGTKRNLRTRVWWPGLDLDVERFVRTCHSCQISGKPPDRDPVRVTEMPNGPWEDVAIDLLGPLPNGENILVVVDYYSRYYETRILTSTVSSKIIRCLQEIFDTHGLPISLKSDNGRQFISGEFKDYLNSAGIEHYLVTPRWPEANGEVERQNRSIGKRIKIAYSEGRSYKEELRKFIVAYRNTPHTVTGKTPAELLFGRKPRVKIPQIRDILDDSETRDRDTEYKHKMVETRNSKLTEKEIRVGDLVLLKRDNCNKTDTPFYKEPHTVRDVRGNMVVVESGDGRIVRRNISFVKPYLLPDASVSGNEKNQSPDQPEDTVAEDLPNPSTETDISIPPEPESPIAMEEADGNQTVAPDQPTNEQTVV